MPKSLIVVLGGSLYQKDNTIFCEQSEQTLITQLLNEGIHIHLIAFTAQQSSGHYAHPLPKNKHLYTHFVTRRLADKASVLHIIFVYWQMFALMRRVLRDNRAAMVYMYYPNYLAPFAAWQCRRLHLNYGVYVRGDTHDCYRLFAKRLLLAARFVYTTGESLRHKISTINANCQLVVPMIAADLTVFQALPRRDYSRCQKGLLIARMVEAKGYRRLLQAAVQLSGEVARWTLVGYANEAVAHEIKQYSRGQSATHIDFQGAVGNIQKLLQAYQQADFFVFPSMYPEGFPRVIYEAMLSGLPVISTILPSMRSFLKNGKNCLQLVSASSEEIIEKIRLLQKDSHLRQRIGECGKKQAMAYFNQFDGDNHARQIMSQL